MQSVSAKFHQFTPLERRATLSLASIIAMRMFGLFMIFPVMSLYIGVLPGATPSTVGFAIGAYALTQGFLQIPFGMLSDRWGRKPVIFIGLALFALGSIVAAMSDTIWGMIAGRIIQGCGAVSAAVMALTADLTREETRTKALATIGMSIGAAVMMALILGPVLNKIIGINGIFWITSGIALFGMAVLFWLVPDPADSHFHRDTEPVPGQFYRVLSNAQLMRLNFGIFSLHAIFAACFLVFPLLLKNSFELESHQHWWVYIPVMSLSMIIMVPMIIAGERYRKMKQMFVSAVLLVIIATFGMYYSVHNWLAIALLMILFFGAFNFLEAALPSLVSKTAPPEAKGTAMGVYATTQYFGTFLGAYGGGLVLHNYVSPAVGANNIELISDKLLLTQIPSVFIFCIIISVIWLLVTLSMENPRNLSTQLLNVGKMNDSDAQHVAMKLTAVQGVAEAVVIGDEGVAYLKVDSKALDEKKLYEYSVSENFESELKKDPASA
ncbi:Inner membrane transport protein YajR [hydrothermal vent metagenome]|uniref:Inner membrane transport protein YajR n=1 Tax=hydrothermal vent metagenome TaxID=652676 RepID=A0A3B0YTI2_9ZZZZ